MNFEVIRWENEKIVLLDQTKLPGVVSYRVCLTITELHDAITVLAVRGAPLLGVAAAYGLYLGIKDYKEDTTAAFLKEMEWVAAYIKTSRPTAVNLFWALERMLARARQHEKKSVAEIKQILFREAERIKHEDYNLCRAMGENGESLIEEGDVILTHCNAGALATAGIGTALAPLYVAKEKGRKFRVYVDETRPLLQGARLTAWELTNNKIDAILICDNMAASLMQKGIIKKVIVGADRVARNGDAANKIGTYGVAVLAKHHGIPFYIAVPYSSFDMALKDGAAIPIEERSEEELKKIGEKQIAPDAVHTYNPAFDVTPHEFITAFITDRQVIYPPFEDTLQEIV